MRKLLAVLVLLSYPWLVSAQIAMTRARIPMDFVALTSAGGATTSSATGDDAIQGAVPIGFAFNYLGTPYTALSVSSNGWIAFDAGIGNAASANSALFNANAPNLTLAPWWDDLATTTAADTAHIQYQTSGAPGARVFTLQWTSLSYASVATRVLRFQVKLFETSNVIEFHYDPNVAGGVMSTAESASIGLENVGAFLDAVTGASSFGFGFMAQEKWPTQGFRFTPGAPTPLAAGTYAVGAGGDFPNLSEAFAALNHRGIAGTIEFVLSDPVYDMTPAGGSNVFPLALGPIAGVSAASQILFSTPGAPSQLRYPGASAGFIITAAAPSLIDASLEPMVLLLGTDFVEFGQLELTSEGDSRLDRGLMLGNISSSDGATNNVMQNLKVRLALDNNSIGIDQITLFTPSADAGANSDNAYYNLDIAQAANGIRLLSIGMFPDQANTISTSPASTRNLIGSLTSPGLRQVDGPSVGIHATNQSGLTLERNDIRNVVCGVSPCAGIVVNASHSTSRVGRNKIIGVRIGTNVAASVDGISAANAGSNAELNIYNNFVAGLSHAYSGAATTTRLLRGIVLQPAGGGSSSQNFVVDHNSVAIDGSAAANASSTALEIVTGTMPFVNFRSNVLANFTAAQTAPAAHFAVTSAHPNQTGNVGSHSDHNDFYIANPTQGFVGLGATTIHPTISDWSMAMQFADGQSFAADPGFVAPQSDLHATNPLLLGAGFSPSNLLDDIDLDARGDPPDVGADEFVPVDLFKNGFE